MIHHIKRATRIMVFWALLGLAVLLSILRIALNEAGQFKSELEAVIGEAIDAPCKIGNMYVNIYGLTPKLVLNDIDVLTEDRQSAAVVLQQIQLRLDLLTLFYSWDVLASTRVTLIGAELAVVRKAKGGITIAGLKAGEGDPLWLLASGQYQLINSKVSWLDEKLKTSQYRFEGVDIFIDNTLPEQRHRINLKLSLPDKTPGKLRFSMLFSGNLFEANQVDGKFYAEATLDKLENAASEYLPLNLKLKSGRGRLSLWGGLFKSKLTDLAGSVSMSDARLSRPETETIVLDKAVSTFVWNKTQHGWRVAVKKIRIEDQDKSWRQNNFSLAGGYDDEGSLVSIAGSFQQLDLPGINYWIVKTGLLPKKFKQRLKSAQLQGQLDHFHWFFDVKSYNFAVNGGFSQLSVNNINNLPGLKHLAGSIYGGFDKGYVFLKSEGSYLLLPELYDAELYFSRLNGKINWQSFADFWSLTSSGLALGGNNFLFDLQGEIKLPKSGDSELSVDLQAELGRISNLRTIIDYLPAKLIGPEDMEWINDTILSGELLKGTVVFHGNPKQYPFHQGQGVCKVNLALHDFGLNYHPKWPVVSKMDAQLALLGDRLQVEVQRADVNGALLHKTVGLIPSLYTSDYIYLEGQVIGAIGQTIGFLQQSPLVPKIHPVLQAISMQGQNTIDLKLDLGLNKNTTDRVYGVAHISDAEFLIHGVNIPVTEVTGDLIFTEDALYSGPINAIALGNPVAIKIDAFKHFYDVTAVAKTDIEQLSNVMQSSFWEYAQGAFNYQLNLRVPYETRGVPRLTVQSDLIGVQLRLPDFLAKTAQQASYLSTELEFKHSRYKPFKFNYADRLKAAIEIDFEQETLYSANVLIGNGMPEIRHRPFKSLVIERHQVDLYPWMDILNNGSTLESSNSIDEFRINTAHLKWKQQDFGPFAMTVKRLNEDWQGDLKNGLMSGRVNLPLQMSKDKKIVLDLQFVDLDYFDGGRFKVTGTPVMPLDMPLFKLTSKQLLWQKINLGALSIDTQKSDDGLLFKKFIISKPNRRLELYGSRWWQHENESKTELAGIMEMKDFGIFLSEVGVTHDMRQSPVKIDFSARWPGGPFDISLSTIQAALSINIKAGRVMGVEPGIGRLLGIMDIRQLGRRLRFDFSDVYAEGLSYDQISGDFQVQDGVAETGNLYVDALPALIKITGTSNLIQQSYEQVITVLPKSSAAIPIAGTIVDGVTALVTKTMTGKTKEGLLFGMQYALKGSWQDPIVTPLHRNQGLITKAWQGITDLSWLGQEKEEVESKND